MGSTYQRLDEGKVMLEASSGPSEGLLQPCPAEASSARRRNTERTGLWGKEQGWRPQGVAQQIHCSLLGRAPDPARWARESAAKILQTAGVWLVAIRGGSVALTPPKCFQCAEYWMKWGYKKV